jgi:hypothetical protein
MEAVYWGAAGFIGLLIGAALGSILSGAKSKGLLEKIRLVEQENGRLNLELSAEREKRIASSVEASELKTRIEMERAAYEEKLALLNKAKEELSSGLRPYRPRPCTATTSPFWNWPSRPGKVPAPGCRRSGKKTIVDRRTGKTP